jgi:hypothetical protein
MPDESVVGLQPALGRYEIRERGLKAVIATPIQVAALVVGWPDVDRCWAWNLLGRCRGASAQGSVNEGNG